MDVYTVKSGADEINRSTLWLRQAIWLKKVKAEKIGNQWVIPGSEIRRIKKKPFQITREEMGIAR